MAGPTAARPPAPDPSAPPTRRWESTARGAALALVPVLAADALLRTVALPRAAWGLLDEAAHLATAALLLAGFLPGLPRPVRLAALVGAVAIDLDHLPSELGWPVIHRGVVRPYSHSLATVFVLVLAAPICPPRARPVVAGLALGVSLHLFRDLATGGVPLLWPASADTVRLPYALYAAVVVLAALLVAARRVPVVR